MDGRCRTGQIIHLVDLGIIGIDYIVTHQLKMVVADERPDVFLAACEKVVEAYHIISLIQ